jgi:hypothetical protein
MARPARLELIRKKEQLRRDGARALRRLRAFPRGGDWFERALEKNANAGWYSCSSRTAPRCYASSSVASAAARATELQEAFLSGREGLIAGGYIRAGHLAALQGVTRKRSAITYVRSTF